MSLLPFSHFHHHRALLDWDLWHRPLHWDLDFWDPFWDHDFDFWVHRHRLWFDHPDLFHFHHHCCLPAPASSSLSSFRPETKINVEFESSSSYERNSNQQQQQPPAPAPVRAPSPKPVNVSPPAPAPVLESSSSARHEVRVENRPVREFRNDFISPFDFKKDAEQSLASVKNRLFNSDLQHNECCGGDPFPKVSNDGKWFTLTFNVPENINASKLEVSVSGNDLVVRGEDKVEQQDSRSEASYYRRTTLPQNTDFDAIKCVMNKNVMTLTAPLKQDFRSNQRNIPIESGRNNF